MDDSSTLGGLVGGGGGGPFTTNFSISSRCLGVYGTYSMTPSQLGIAEVVILLADEVSMGVLFK